MSTRDKELKQSFIELFSNKLRETAPTYFSRKRDQVVEGMSFSEEELEEIESELREILFAKGEDHEHSED